MHEAYFRRAAPNSSALVLAAGLLCGSISKEKTVSIKTAICLGILLASAPLLTAQRVTPSANPPCGGRSTTGFANWPQFQSDPCHTGYNANEFILSPVNVGNIAAGWQGSTGGSSSPAVVNGVAYIGSFDGNVYALNASTGAQLWKYTTDGASGASPAVANGLVYAASQGKTLFALNAATGALVWKYNAQSYFGSPVVADGIVYFASDVLNAVVAVDAATGTFLWQYQAPFAVTSTVAVANGVVYADATGVDLLALDAKTGILRWIYPTGNTDNVDTAPAVANGVVYVSVQFSGGGNKSGLDAVDAATGTRLWRYPIDLGEFVTTPAVANGIVYCATNYPDGYLYALDATNGTLVWRQPISSNGGSPAAIANGVVYFGADGPDLYALDAAKGTILWDYKNCCGGGATPVIVNGVVYDARDQTLHTFHLSSHR